jgi:hypothetical protein
LVKTRREKGKLKAAHTLDKMFFDIQRPAFSTIRQVFCCVPGKHVPAILPRLMQRGKVGRDVFGSSQKGV